MIIVRMVTEGILPETRPPLPFSVSLISLVASRSWRVESEGDCISIVGVLPLGLFFLKSPMMAIGGMERLLEEKNRNDGKEGEGGTGRTTLYTSPKMKTSPTGVVERPSLLGSSYRAARPQVKICSPSVRRQDSGTRLQVPTCAGNIRRDSRAIKRPTVGDVVMICLGFFKPQRCFAPVTRDQKPTADAGEVGVPKHYPAFVEALHLISMESHRGLRVLRFKR